MKLSRIVITLMFVGIVGMAVSAPELYADPVSGGQSIYFEFAYGNEYRPVFGIDGRGGAFATYDTTSHTFLFNTFCIETNEYINLSTPYHVGSITGVAVANGTNESKGYQAAFGGDPLDTRTAYLFSKFWTGTLTGYDTSTPAKAAMSANALQRTIWFIEQEYGNTIKDVNGNWVGDWTNPGYYLGSDATGVLAQTFFADASHANGTLYDVQVLNVVDGNLQSMLVCVPEPGVLMLLFISLSSVGLAARHYRLVP